MSIILGTREPLGAIITRQELLSIARATEGYAPDGTWVAVEGRVGMGFQPYHTHERSNLDSQPVIDAEGNMVTLDGRIDNHKELRSALHRPDEGAPDSEIVLAAFRRWGEGCFSRLVGDWALAIWSAADATVYLARDHAGTRTLYYELSNGRLLWSTCLETFFALGHNRPLSSEYAAAYLGFRPAGKWTPYAGIFAVSPMHYLVVRGDRILEQPHWDWKVSSALHCKSDLEYEELFLTHFRRAVERRIGPGAPIVAQLSGGMDSTSIVCVCDNLRKAAGHPSEPIDTVSFYDDSEPDWNERPYFSAVEASRGKTGTHIETSWRQRTFDPPGLSNGIYRCPGADSASIQHEMRLEAMARHMGCRVILSGAGGDEVLGGVPTPLPELAGHLVSGQLSQLFRRAIDWGIATRDPLISMIGKTTRYTLGLYCGSDHPGRVIPFWITRRLRRNSSDPFDLAEWTARLGSRPQAIDNARTWYLLLETLPHLAPSLLARYEYRYPYLDRDLVDFVFRIPREQLVRPGRRRSLMRRALRGIVPEEVLERRRKAYIIRGPLVCLERARNKILALFRRSLTAELGFIDDDAFRRAFESIARGEVTPWLHAALRTILFELWLRSRQKNS
jgi:asparagine synthase (glutamine-hydrolysing)